MSTNTLLVEKDKLSLKKPQKFKVVMYNDDFTPMDVVVEILITVFHKNYQEAVDIMLTVHKGSKAIVGLYSYDIAHTKKEQAVTIARDLGYPFRIEVEA